MARRYRKIASRPKRFRPGAIAQSLRKAEIRKQQKARYIRTGRY